MKDFEVPNADAKGMVNLKGRITTLTRAVCDIYSEIVADFVKEQRKLGISDDVIMSRVITCLDENNEVHIDACTFLQWTRDELAKELK